MLGHGATGAPAPPSRAPSSLGSLQPQAEAQSWGRSDRQPLRAPQPGPTPRWATQKMCTGLSWDHLDFSQVWGPPSSRLHAALIWLLRGSGSHWPPLTTLGGSPTSIPHLLPCFPHSFTAQKYKVENASTKRRIILNFSRMLF